MRFRVISADATTKEPLLFATLADTSGPLSATLGKKGGSHLRHVGQKRAGPIWVHDRCLLDEEPVIFSAQVRLAQGNSQPEGRVKNAEFAVERPREPRKDKTE